jgi:hypothetical protein
MAVAFDMSALWLLEEAGSARSTRGVELDQDVDWEILEESVTDVFNAPPPPSPPGLGRWLPSGLRRFLRRFGIG